MTNAEGEEGTTLLEALVAVALLALLCAYAIGALKHIQSFNRATRDIEAENAVEAVATHLRRTLEGARAVFVKGQGDGSAQLAFAGEANRLTLVANADSRLEYGGLYLVEFALDEAGNLIAHRRAFRPDLPLAFEGADPIPLSDGITGFELRYFGPDARGGEPSWHDTWISEVSLPRAIEITVTFSAGDPRRWPPLIVTIAAAR